MKYARYDTLEFGDSTYIVVDSVNLNNNNYVYLVLDSDDKDEYALVKEIVTETGQISFKNIDNDQEFDEVTKLIVLENKDYIKSMMGE